MYHHTVRCLFKIGFSVKTNLYIRIFAYDSYRNQYSMFVFSIKTTYVYFIKIESGNR